MGLVNLTATPRSEDQWRVMWWNNWNEHQSIVKAIATQRNIPLQMYMIWPWTTTDLDKILQQHQQFHNDMLAVLNLPGLDLSVLDINDQQAVAAWNYEHYQEHLAVNTALKL